MSEIGEKVLKMREMIKVEDKTAKLERKVRECEKQLRRALKMAEKYKTPGLQARLDPLRNAVTKVVAELALWKAEPPQEAHSSTNTTLMCCIMAHIHGKIHMKYYMKHHGCPGPIETMEDQMAFIVKKLVNKWSSSFKDEDRTMLLAILEAPRLEKYKKEAA